MTSRVRPYLFGIAAAGIVSAVFHGLGVFDFLSWRVSYSDLAGFYDAFVAKPGLPYIDKAVEYPVLTGWFIAAMGFLGGTRAGYYVLSAIVLIAIAAGATYGLTRLLPEERRSRMWVYWIFAPSTLLFLVFNWDIIAVGFVVCALLAMAKQKHGLAAFFLALGFSAKFYPVIYLAPLLLRVRTVRHWAIVLGVFLSTALALNAFFAVFHFDSWSYFFTFNSTRNSNPDSFWTVIRYFLFHDRIGVPAINMVSLALFSGSFLWTLIRYRRAPTSALCLLGTLLFLLTNKVVTAQYLLWLLPFFVVSMAPPKTLFYVLEFSNYGAFFAILGWFFEGRDLAYFYASVPFVILRHLALFLVFILLLLKLRGSSPQRLAEGSLV